MALNVQVTCAKISKPYQLTIHIQGDLPKAMNKIMRSHWTKNNSDQGRWRKLIGSPAMLFRPDKPLVSYRVSAVRYNYRMLDFDGLVASLKPCIDALKGIIIEDDRWSMTGQWDVNQEFRSKADGPALKIIITQR